MPTNYRTTEGYRIVFVCGQDAEARSLFFTTERPDLYIYWEDIYRGSEALKREKPDGDPYKARVYMTYMMTSLLQNLKRLDDAIQDRSIPQGTYIVPAEVLDDYFKEYMFEDQALATKALEPFLSRHDIYYVWMVDEPKQPTDRAIYDYPQLSDINLLLIFDAIMSGRPARKLLLLSTIRELAIENEVRSTRQENGEMDIGKEEYDALIAIAKANDILVIMDGQEPEIPQVERSNLRFWKDPDFQPESLGVPHPHNLNESSNDCEGD